jgi:hypothetical protein
MVTQNVSAVANDDAKALAAEKRKAKAERIAAEREKAVKAAELKAAALVHDSAKADSSAAQAEYLSDGVSVLIEDAKRSMRAMLKAAELFTLYVAEAVGACDEGQAAKAFTAACKAIDDRLQSDIGGSLSFNSFRFLQLDALRQLVGNDDLLCLLLPSLARECCKLVKRDAVDCVSYTWQKGLKADDAKAFVAKVAERLLTARELPAGIAALTAGTPVQAALEKAASSADTTAADENAGKAAKAAKAPEQIIGNALGKIEGTERRRAMVKMVKTGDFKVEDVLSALKGFAIAQDVKALLAIGKRAAELAAEVKAALEAAKADDNDNYDD